MQVLKPFSRFISFKSIRYHCIHTYIYRMDKVYVRCPADSSVFDLSFQFVDSSLGLNRQFNFSRKLEENVETFLSRISTNLEKAIGKTQKKKKQNATPEVDYKSKIQLFLNENEVSGTEICKDVFISEGTLKLKVFDHEYQVLINSPWVKYISLPTSMLANFPVYPARLETIFTEIELSDFEWFKSADKIQWKFIGKGFIYYPKKHDIGCYIKVSCIPKNKEEFGPRTETQSECVVEASPGTCPFESRHKFTKEKLSGIKVMSYNILADTNCDTEFARTELYYYCPPYALKIDYRKQLILKELIGYNADIICLQEVDDKVFTNDLKPVLETLNYQGNFTKKYGNIREGSACFYNRKRLQFLNTTSLVYAQELSQNELFMSIWSKVKSNNQLIKRFCELGTILQITILKVIGFNEILMVANTHLYFHPDSDHIRLLQGGMALIYIQSVMKQLEQKYGGRRISLIFCGDFNSVPSCGVYELYTKGCIEMDHPDWTSNCEEAVKGVSLSNSRIMTSACGTPKYTNFTMDFRDCLDYIFYESNKFIVTQVIPLFSFDELKAHKALPSVVAPSDHVSVIADLQLVNN